MTRPGFGRSWGTLALLVLALLPSYSGAQRPVTPRPGPTHPATRPIRALATRIDAMIGLGAFTTYTDSAECNGGSERVTARLYTDSSGQARKYVRAGGSDDAAGEVKYYYDTRGRLRFSVEVLGAVNGTQRETRVYFDTTGTPIYKDVRLTKGPGYPGGFELVIADPAEDFRSLCGPPDRPQR